MILIRPVASEKAVRLMEAQNVITFIVDYRANKNDIKKAFEKEFNVKVVKINTLNTTKNEKKAYIKLSDKDNALDVGAEVGVI